MSQEPDKFHVEEAPRIKQDLLERIRREVDRFGRTSQDSAMLRAEVRVLGLDSIDWLCAQRPMARGYWADREEAFEVAGTGRADMIAGDVSEPFVDVVARLMERITSCSGDIRYIGGFRFDERGNHDPAWDRFKSYRFIPVTGHNYLELFILADQASQLFGNVHVLNFFRFIQGLALHPFSYQ